MDIQQLLNVKTYINKINEKIPDEHKNFIFWCPKDMDSNHKKQGFTLYAYGGRVLDIYICNDDVNFSLFDKDYKSYFVDGWQLVEEILAKTKMNASSAVRMNKLLIWDGPKWDIVMNAFKERAENLSGKQSKRYLERERETVIAKVNRTMEKEAIRIIEMEPKIEGGKKPDLIGIRKDEESYIISFIEYKCTMSGMTTVPLVEHFDDMIKYYQNTCIHKQILEYNRRLAVMEGLDESVCNIGDNKVESEIIFLFSHVNHRDGVSARKIVNDLLVMKSHGEFATYENYIKFVVLEDEHKIILADSLYSYEEFKRYLEYDDKSEKGDAYGI